MTHNLLITEGIISVGEGGPCQVNNHVREIVPAPSPLPQNSLAENLQIYKEISYEDYLLNYNLNHHRRLDERQRASAFDDLYKAFPSFFDLPDEKEMLEIEEKMIKLMAKPKPKKAKFKYFGTFTLSPKNRDKERSQILAINKILKSKIFDVVRSDFNTERTQKGIQHLHLYMECNKYARKKVIADHFYNQNTFGTFDWQICKNPEACLAYCIKERGVDDLIAPQLIIFE